MKSTLDFSQLERGKRAKSKAATARLERLEKARGSMGWTWGGLAEAVGVTRQTASFWATRTRAVPEPVVRLVELMVRVKGLQK